MIQEEIYQNIGLKSNHKIDVSKSFSDLIFKSTFSFSSFFPP